MSDLLSISAAEANRAFSRLLRDVQQGKAFTITSHGRPVARIVPVEDAGAGGAEAHRQRWNAFLDELAARPLPEHPIGRWTREELYERD